MLVLEGISPWGPCQSEWLVLLPWSTVTSKPGLLPRAMSESVVLTQLETVLMPLAQVATKDHRDV